MTQKNLSYLVNQLVRSSHKNQPTLVTYQDKRLSVVVPVKNQQTFQAQQDEKLYRIKTELDLMLNFVRNRLRKQDTQQALAQLNNLQQQIQQEKDQS